MAKREKVIITRQQIMDSRYAEVRKNLALEVCQPVPPPGSFYAWRPPATHNTMAQPGFNIAARGLDTVKMSCRTTADNAAALITPEALYK
jgi:hypothetical protein